MYTVVSLNVDLAGEPDTIDFTLALFFPNLLSVLFIFASCRGASFREPALILGTFTSDGEEIKQE